MRMAKCVAIASCGKVCQPMNEKLQVPRSKLQRKPKPQHSRLAVLWIVGLGAWGFLAAAPPELPFQFYHRRGRPPGEPAEVVFRFAVQPGVMPDRHLGHAE